MKVLSETHKCKPKAGWGDTSPGRFGKMPNTVATMKGLSPGATSYFAIKTIFPGAFGLNERVTAARFKSPEPDEGRKLSRSQMRRNAIRASRRELIKKRLMRRWQSGRTYARDLLVIEASGHDCRHVPLEWVDDANPIFSCPQFALLLFVRACHGGARPCEIDERFGWSRVTTNKHLKWLILKRWLVNAGTIAAPRYVFAKDPAGLQIQGNQTVETSVSQTLQIQGPKLKVSLETQSKKTQGQESSSSLLNGSLIDGNLSALGDYPKALQSAASKTGSAGVSAQLGEHHEVSRRLIDRAHQRNLDVPDLLKRLAKAIKRLSSTDNPLDTPQKIDRYFAKIADNAAADLRLRCPIGFQPARKRRPQAQIMAEHDTKKTALAAEVGVIAGKWSAITADFEARAKSRFPAPSWADRQAALNRGAALWN